MHDQRTDVQRRVPEPWPGVIESLDGRMWVLSLDSASADAPATTETAQWRTMDGDGSSDDGQRLGLVLRFVDRWRSEIVRAGLAAVGSESLAVREELVWHLLRYPVRGADAEIPRRALRAFLDAWGHRWM